MLAGELPWDKPVYDCEDFISWVKYNNYQKTPWCKIENTALSLLRNMLTYEPGQRFTIRQIKSSAWYVKTYKQPVYEYSNNGAFLSQPTYVFMNSSSSSNNRSNNNRIGLIGVMPTEFEITDSQQNCEFSEHQCMKQNPESFSQPTSVDNMFLNSQVTQTQTASQFGTQSPLLKLVKRMTRMFIHLNVSECSEELKKLFTKFMYDYKCSIINVRQHQITVTTSDKRQTLLTFKVNIVEMNAQNEVLCDFRLSKGDGLEFKKIFMKIKSSLSHVVCKRYVFTNNNGCCNH
jgi:serine/threonine-protein kinase Chk1